MMSVARKYGVPLEGLAFAKQILNVMPMWDHAHADRIRLGRLTVPSKLLTCLQTNHHALMVRDFVLLSQVQDCPAHRPKAACECAECRRLKSTLNCVNPHLCSTRAREIVSTPPGKWNPLLRQPEDYEEEYMEDLRRGSLDVDLVPFDRCVTTKGNLGHAFRIFTDTEDVCNEIMLKVD